MPVAKGSGHAKVGMREIWKECAVRSGYGGLVDGPIMERAAEHPRTCWDSKGFKKGEGLEDAHVVIKPAGRNFQILTTNLGMFSGVSIGCEGRRRIGGVEHM